MSHLLRENKSLKHLVLNGPLDDDEVYDLLHSLEDNHSLEELVIYKCLHAHYFTEQALDPRVHFKNWSIHSIPRLTP